jgi:2-polyprenyl-3-methyl-5-hydroxy-6-metoxy-1,4-benzoquinol methylase
VATLALAQDGPCLELAERAVRSLIPKHGAKYITVLGELRGVPALPVLFSAAENTDESLRASARASLDWNGGPARRNGRPGKPTGRGMVLAPEDLIANNDFFLPDQMKYRAAIVGASAAGKTTLSVKLTDRIRDANSAFAVEHLDPAALVLASTSDLIGLCGREFVLERYPWIFVRQSGANRILDVGALGVLSPIVRGFLRAGDGLNFVLVADIDGLRLRLERDSKHAVSGLLGYPQDFVQSYLVLRQLLSCALSDVVIDTSDASPDQVAEQVWLAIIEEAANQLDVNQVETYPEYQGAADGYYPSPSPAVVNILTRINSTPGARLLDFGGGSGRNAIACALAGAAVTLLEPSRAGAGAARRFARSFGVSPDLTIVVGDISALQRGATFDFIIAMTTFSHISKSELVGSVLPRLAACLNGSGTMVASVFLEDDPGAVGCENSSPTGSYVCSYFSVEEFLDIVGSMFQVTSYDLVHKNDISHGPEHQHSVLEILATPRRSG